MAGTPTVNQIGDIIPAPGPTPGSFDAEIAQLHNMGLHFTAQLLSANKSKVDKPAEKEEE